MGSATEWLGRGSNGRSLTQKQSVTDWPTNFSLYSILTKQTHLPKVKLISQKLTTYTLPKVRFFGIFKISIRRFFGWLGLQIRYSLIQCLTENTCTKFHWSLIENNEVIEVRIFFYKSAFRLVGLDGKIMNLYLRNFSGWYWGLKLTCIPNFTPIGQFLWKLSIFTGFWLVGWLGWFAYLDFRKISRCTAYKHNIHTHQKSSWYLKALRKYPLPKVRFSAFWKNLYKMLFWLVGPKKLIWFDLVPHREHVYQVSSIFD